MATKERLVIEAMLMIASKSRGDVPFELNSAQARLDHALSGFDITAKARQEGVSSYYLARFLVACLGERNVRAVVISHDRESTQRMLGRVNYYIEHIRGPKPIIKNQSKNEITFPKTNSAFYIGTAGSRKFGRGDTITHLHCSEIAYWPDPKSLASGLFQAVPKDGSGEIGIESTGNGVGNYFHNMCMSAAQGRGRYRLHFFPWHTFPEYTEHLSEAEAAEIMANLDPKLEEPEIVERFGIDAGRIAFRRNILSDIDYDLKLFKQEYPFTLDECFQASGSSIFSRYTYRPTDDWYEAAPHMYMLAGHPQKQFTYVLGADPSGGTGNDNSVIEVFCLDTFEQVGEWIHDKTEPDIFAEKIAQVGELFNFAYAVVESNNHGILTLAELRKIYPRQQIYNETGLRSTTDFGALRNEGHRTTIVSKPWMIGMYRKALAEGLVIHSPILVSEMSTFVEKETGKMEAEEGCHDDTVIASCKATLGFHRASMRAASSSGLVQVPQKDPFVLGSLIEELQGRGRTGFLIPDQSSILSD